MHIPTCHMYNDPKSWFLRSKTLIYFFINTKSGKNYSPRYFALVNLWGKGLSKISNACLLINKRPRTEVGIIPHMKVEKYYKPRCPQGFNAGKRQRKLLTWTVTRTGNWDRLWRSLMRHPHGEKTASAGVPKGINETQMFSL